MTDAGDTEVAERQRWLAVIARTTAPDLAAIFERHGGIPSHVVLKAAQSGTTMLEGRAGGTGQRFNLGEATVTRCVVRLESGRVGVCYGLGADTRKAHFGALLDGLLQQQQARPALLEEIARLAEQQRAARDLAARKAAATKVEFFTLVRGDG